MVHYTVKCKTCNNNIYENLSHLSLMKACIMIYQEKLNDVVSSDLWNISCYAVVSAICYFSITSMFYLLSTFYYSLLDIHVIH